MIRALFIGILLLLPSLAWGASPQIAPIANTTSAVGVTYSITPAISNGATGVVWRKEYGPDDMAVDPSTGVISWAIPSTLPRESFHVGVRATNVEGSSYITWVLTVGGGTVRYVGAGQTYTTISAGIAAMASGDTLIIKDGTYTGNANMMTTFGVGAFPPSGSSAGNGVYTTVMAEHPGGATIDAQHTSSPIYGFGNTPSRDGDSAAGGNVSYIAFKGLVAGNPLDSGGSNGCITFNHVNHIKIIDCGAFEADDYTTPISINRSTYILVEGCYVWGNGRMKIVFYLVDYSILRRNVARHDRSITIWPSGIFDLYACQHTRSQNNIALDSDQFNFYSHSDAVGAFVEQSGAGNGASWGTRIDNTIWNAIALNVHNRFTLGQANSASDPTSWNNVIGWDMNAVANNTTNDSGGGAIIESNDRFNINQGTFGHWRSPHYPMYWSSGTSVPDAISGWTIGGTSTQNITNSIFYDFKDYDNAPMGLFDQIESASYNNIFGPSPINIKDSNVSNTISTDPTISCLKYLPRIESGCSLQTAGLSGVRVGANIMTMRGKAGTLFGDADYDTDGVAPMWPFPHEDVIKAKMSAYSYTGTKVGGGTGAITGARGFCAGTSLDGTPQTLTKYIWEYLGNRIPAEIYGIPTLSALRTRLAPTKIKANWIQ